MALLGVLLAFASAKVGGERTELVKTMVEQQTAHAKYQSQDIKHRVAVLSLRQLRAGSRPATAQEPSTSTNSREMLLIANTVNRYLEEADAAKEWVESFDPKVMAHLEGQEYYEFAMLAAEIGIVIASVALLLRLRLVWYVAVLLGISSVGISSFTYIHTSRAAEHSLAKIEETGKHYREMRNAHKTTQADQAMVNEVIANNTPK